MRKSRKKNSFAYSKFGWNLTLNTENKNISVNKLLHHIMIVDESGSKGYGNTPESPTEVIGVMAAILLDECQLPAFSEFASDIASNFTSYKKLHITAFNQEDKKKAITLVGELLDEYNIPWLYSAISTAGFHAQHLRSGYTSKGELLHAVLFKLIALIGLTNAINICHEFNIETFRLSIISDTLDPKTKNMLDKEIRPLIHLYTNTPRVIKKKNREFTITSRLCSVNEDGENIPIKKIREIHFNIDSKESAITFISDVVSYVTYKHLLSKFKENRQLQLISKEALKGHPFESTATFIPDDPDYFIEKTYKTPTEGM